MANDLIGIVFGILFTLVLGFALFKSGTGYFSIIGVILIIFGILLILAVVYGIAGRR